MFGLPLAFAAPAVLAALALLAALYLFLQGDAAAAARDRLPAAAPADRPRPQGRDAGQDAVAAAGAAHRRRRAGRSLAMAGPIWNAVAARAGDGPLLIVRRRRLGGGAELGAPHRPTRATRSTAATRAGRLVALAADLARRPRRRRARRRRAAKIACARWRPSLTRRSARRRCRRSQRFLAANPQAEVVWIADGVELGGASAFARALAGAARGHTRVRRARPTTPIGVAGVDNLAGALEAHLTRADAHGAADAGARARARRPGPLDRRSAVRLRRGARGRGEVSICRSSCATRSRRLVVADEPSAGAAWLVDERSRRRRVAILSGASADVAQPLLSPAYYIKRALAPFAEIREWRRRRAAIRSWRCSAEKPSVLALADMSVAARPGARQARRLRRIGRRAAALRRHAARRRRRRSDADRAAGAAAARSAARCRGRRPSTSRRSTRRARSSASPRPTK